MRFLILNHDANRFRQEISLRGLNLEFKKLKPADTVKAAQATTATLYKDWQDTKVAEVTPPGRLSNFLSSASTQMEKKRAREREAFQRYFKQGERRNSDH